MRPGTWSTAAGTILVALLLTAVVAGPTLAPHDPLQVDLTAVLRSPDRSFPLGTDQLGRCIWSRVLHGARLSVGLSVLASLGALVLGMAMGVPAAWRGGRLDTAARGVIDVGLGFPALALALVLGTSIGSGMPAVAAGLAGAAAPWWARFTRDLTRTALTREFVLGGRVAGVSTIRLLRCYVLPQVLPVLAVTCAWRSALMLGALTGFSYLGLGAQPPIPEWGAMLQEGRMYSGQAIWVVLAPGAATSLAVGSFVLLAEGLRDLLGASTRDVWTRS